MSTQNEDHTLQTIDNRAIFKEALVRALAELEKLKQIKTEMAAREIQLQQSIKALTPLVGSTIPAVKDMSLSNAVRLTFKGLPPGKSLGAIGVRAKLEELGYDLSGYDNPLASIHTCLRRMEETEEITLVKSEDKKKKFETGPELKSVPESELDEFPDAIDEVSE